VKHSVYNAERFFQDLVFEVLVRGIEQSVNHTVKQSSLLPADEWVSEHCM